VRFFPELSEMHAETQPNGKLKLAIDTSSFGSLVRHAERALVCVVERHEGADTRLEAMDATEAVALLSANREAGFDLYDGAEAVAEELVGGGVYRIIVGHEPAQAPAVLRSLARQWSGRAEAAAPRQRAAIADNSARAGVVHEELRAGE